MVKYLELLFSRSMQEGKLPQEWKEAVVVPIYNKGGSKEDPASYRPVSITSAVGKVMESDIHRLSLNCEHHHRGQWYECTMCIPKVRLRTLRGVRTHFKTVHPGTRPLPLPPPRGGASPLRPGPPPWQTLRLLFVAHCRRHLGPPLRWMAPLWLARQACLCPLAVMLGRHLGLRHHHVPSPPWLCSPCPQVVRVPCPPPPDSAWESDRSEEEDVDGAGLSQEDAPLAPAAAAPLLADQRAVPRWLQCRCLPHFELSLTGPASMVGGQECDPRATPRRVVSARSRHAAADTPRPWRLDVYARPPSLPQPPEPASPLVHADGISPVSPAGCPPGRPVPPGERIDVAVAPAADLSASPGGGPVLPPTPPPLLPPLRPCRLKRRLPTAGQMAPRMCNARPVSEEVHPPPLTSALLETVVLVHAPPAEAATPCPTEIEGTLMPSGWPRQPSAKTALCHTTAVLPPSWTGGLPCGRGLLMARLTPPSLPE
ncbi:basic proline-rich protein-like [Bacillus rossius redtenbacheri]|uniref:basic proline-rich protein-like n=1 Tax=Bacillus rossius redtenbacheri TaxID=93214 RepID=UPI002FDED0A6